MRDLLVEILKSEGFSERGDCYFRIRNGWVTEIDKEFTQIEVKTVYHSLVDRTNEPKRMVELIRKF